MHARRQDRSKSVVIGMLIAVISIVAISIWGVPGANAAQITATPGSGSTAMACEQVLPYAQQNLSEGCNALDQNEICYGNRTNVITWQPNSGGGPFIKPGDIVGIDLVKALSAAPLNLERGEWGLSVLKMQANLPGTVAGQAITFILYGDTNIEKQD